MESGYHNQEQFSALFLEVTQSVSPHPKICINAPVERCLMSEVSFDNTEADKAIIEKVIQRLREFDADERDPLNRHEEEYTQVRVTIAAAQANKSGPFRLERLLSFDMVSFYHDIWGFYDNTSRETGELLNCWIPRCGQRNGHD